MAGSFGAYVEARKAGAISPEVQGQNQTSEGQTNDAEPTNYEQARANMSGLVPAAVASSWQAVDRDEQQLRQRVEQIIEDDTRTPEFKGQEAQELYQRSAQAIGEKRQQVKADLQKAADASYRASVPIFSGASLSPANTNELLADQQSASRLVRIAQSRAEKSGKLGYSPTSFLQEQYRRGLEIQGAEGASLVRGSLMAAEELGLEAEDILQGEGIRQPRHREYADKARRLAWFSEMITTQAPELPRRTRDRLQRLARGSTSSARSTVGANRNTAALVGGEREQIATSAGESHNRGSSAPKRSKKRFK